MASRSARKAAREARKNLPIATRKSPPTAAAAATADTDLPIAATAAPDIAIAELTEEVAKSTLDDGDGSSQFDRDSDIGAANNDADSAVVTINSLQDRVQQLLENLRERDTTIEELEADIQRCRDELKEKDLEIEELRNNREGDRQGEEKDDDNSNVLKWTLTFWRLD